MSAIYTRLAVLFAVLILIGCSNSSNENPPSSDTASMDNMNHDCGASAKFQIDSWPEDSMGVPHSVITVEACNMSVTLDTIIGAAQLYDHAEFKDMEIPTEAIEACGAWFAGGGDYYYVIKKNNAAEVYHGWLDEGQTDEGYHWEKVSEIK